MKGSKRITEKREQGKGKQRMIIRTKEMKERKERQTRKEKVIA